MSRWYVSKAISSHLKLIRYQPGVKDAQTEMLIDEKVDAFWKAVENGANKRGQVCAPMPA